MNNLAFISGVMQSYLANKARVQDEITNFQSEPNYF